MPKQNHLQSRDGEGLPPNHKSQLQLILELLVAANGAEVPLAEIMVHAAQYSWCIHQLRKRGYEIVNRSETRNGVRHSWYRLESSPAAVGAEPAPPLSETTRPPCSLEPAQPLSLFPEMSASAAQPQRPVWRDPELGGVKHG